MRIRIVLTPTDLKNDFASMHNCPMATAVKRQVKKDVRVIAGSRNVRINNKDYFIEERGGVHFGRHVLLYQKNPTGKALHFYADIPEEFLKPRRVRAKVLQMA